jgi:hypothetical protein
MYGTKQPYWVIEHRSRGCFVGMIHSDEKSAWTPRFRWSILRSDPQVVRYRSEAAARLGLRKLSDHVKGCYLVAMQASAQPRPGRTSHPSNR